MRWGNNIDHDKNCSMTQRGLGRHGMGVGNGRTATVNSYKHDSTRR